jgi:hypothetical protein
MRVGVMMAVALPDCVVSVIIPPETFTKTSVKPLDSSMGI